MSIETPIANFPRERVIRICLIVAAIWVLCVIFGWIFQPAQFYRAYLLAWLFWLGVSLGAMGVVMLHHLMGGYWGFLVRRMGEHAGMALPMMLVLIIPILLGMHSLFPWDRADELAKDAVLRHEQPYLNPTFFIVRVIIYFVIWIGCAWYLRSGSLRVDRTGDALTVLHLHNLSAGAMLVYSITMSFASVDWIMSLEPGFFSTVFGFMVLAGQGISGACALIVLFCLMANAPAFQERAEKNYLNDLGNLLLTFVIVWAYVSFAQLLVIWMGYKQDELQWYVHRLSFGWWWIGLALVVLHFFVPFLVLLMRELKRQVPMMLGLCGGLLVMRVIDLFWQTAAGGSDPYFTLWSRFTWMDIAFPIGMGALWLALVLWLSLNHPLVPQGYSVPANATPASLEE